MSKEKINMTDSPAALLTAEMAKNVVTALASWGSRGSAMNALVAIAEGRTVCVPAAPPVAEAEEREALTFDQFRAANVARCVKWHPAGIDSWSPSDWLVAVTGELGELASLLKMRNRERDGLPGNKFSPTQKQIADELADVLTYLDLLAEVLGVNLGAAAVEKFNEVSERVGFPDRIELRTRASPPKVEEPNAAQFPNDLHPKTLLLVKRFMVELAWKLRAAQIKYGYGDGWLQDNWMDECRAKLREHVDKGDPRDVAAYCAFLWHHGEPTSTPPAAPDKAVEQGAVADAVGKWLARQMAPFTDSRFVPDSFVELAMILQDAPPTVQPADDALPWLVTFEGDLLATFAHQQDAHEYFNKGNGDTVRAREEPALGREARADDALLQAEVEFLHETLDAGLLDKTTVALLRKRRAEIAYLSRANRSK